MKGIILIASLAIASVSMAQSGEYYYYSSSPQIYWMATEYHCLTENGSDVDVSIDSVDMTYAWVHKRYTSASWGPVPAPDFSWETEVDNPDVNETKKFDYTWGGITLAAHKELCSSHHI